MIKTVTDMRELEDLASGWNRLAENFKNPLLNYEWFAACADSLYKESDLHVVTVLSGDNVVAIAPLAATKKRGVKWMELMGTSFLHEPSGLLYDSEESLAELIKHLINLRVPISLKRIPLDASVSKVLRRFLKLHGLMIERGSSGSASVPIKSGWDEFYKTISSRRRYDIRRAQRRSEKKGRVSFRIFCPEPDELDKYLNIAFEIEAAGWKGRGGSALLFNQRLQGFFRRYAMAACSSNILRLCYMKVDDEAIAMQIALEYADRFWVLKIGYDEKWAECSPGIQLTHECVRYSFDRDLKSYEFLGSNEPWLHVWAREMRSYSSIGLYPAAVNGIYSLGADLADYARAKVKQKFIREGAPGTAN